MNGNLFQTFVILHVHIDSFTCVQIIIFGYAPGPKKCLQTSRPLVQTLNARLPFETTTTCVDKSENDNEIRSC